MCVTDPRQTFLDRKLTKLPAQLFALFFPIFTANHSFSCPRVSLVHRIRSLVRAAAQAQLIRAGPSQAPRVTCPHRIASPNLTNPLLLLPLAVPRTHNYFACPTRVRCGILPHIGSMFFKGFKCIFPYLIARSISL